MPGFSAAAAAKSLQSCLTLCDPIDGSPSGSPVPGILQARTLEASQSFTIYRSLLKLMSIELVMPTNHLILCCFLSSCLQSFPASGSFPTCCLLASGGQSIVASASASVLPINIQGSFPLGLTGLISLLSKGISRVFSGTSVHKHQFFSMQPSLCSNSYIHS